ncbi:hypothetical protein C8J56DRAFT_1060967 [Mycena floridula]|nr:hypothetical protein C8J56DRAFT_1060967 [Mycena floridula]
MNGHGILVEESRMSALGDGVSAPNDHVSESPPSPIPSICVIHIHSDAQYYPASLVQASVNGCALNSGLARSLGTKAKGESDQATAMFEQK